MSVTKGQKVGLIGRNGAGKTTLLNMINGSDVEYDGQIEIKKNAVLVTTSQEHLDIKGASAVEYIVENLPRYESLKKIIDGHPKIMEGKMHLINEYSQALDEFSALGYFEAEAKAIGMLSEYQIDEKLATGKMSNLSGGQKRFVELVKVQLSGANIALIDEPTNHMDYVAKAAFIDWVNNSSLACIIISHDRDVLGNVEKIIEIKDKKAYDYKGGYKEYLAQNSHKTSSQLQNYEIALQTIAKLKDRIEYAKARAPGYKGGSAKNPWIVLKTRLEKQLVKVEADNPKPSFWLDQESAENLSHKVVGSYEKYKAKNIKIKPGNENENTSELVRCEDLQLSYGAPLFKPLSFVLRHGDRLHIIGRNGAGKTTLVKAIQASYLENQIKTLEAGNILPGRQLKLAVYEQELGSEILNMSLSGAIEHIYMKAGVQFSNQTAMRMMGDYLFDPNTDADKVVNQLSGGQKARLQIIRMLAGKPNLLILDEPTNHLDLPSIEELENALVSYTGAILYISHDSYFAKNIGGQEIKLQTLVA